jgi:hypothetical protein
MSTVVTSAQRPIVASILTRGWSIARSLEGDSLRGAFGKNLVATGDPIAAATLTEGWAASRRIDGDSIRGAFTKNLAATGDAESASILTRGWALARTRDGSSIRDAYAKNLAATGDAWAAAELTSGWAIARTREGSSIREAYAKNLAATGDARAAARLTSGWAIAGVLEGSRVRDAFARNLAVTQDARAAAELTHGWAARQALEDVASLSGDRVRGAYAKNLAATGDARLAATLTSGWAEGTIDGATVRSAWNTNLQRLRQHDPEAVAVADEARARLVAGTGTDADLAQLFDVYGAAMVRETIPQLRWRAIAKLFDLSVERNDTTRFVPTLLADARDHLARLTPRPETTELRRSTSELIERNLARIAGDHGADPVRGYADHADYGEVGRIVSSMSLLDELDTPIRTRPPEPADALGATVAW